MKITAAHVIQARRELARDYLIDFTAYTLPTYEPAPHHQMIAERLEAVERGDLTRLMIFMPPRHGKSELASRRFPAWFLGRNPDAEIIAASYNSDLAADFGREVRSILREDEYQELFKVGVRSDSAAANRWHTDQGGAYRAAGVATAMTGRGADVLLIDDPVKDREEADSEVRRERVWDWYRSTAYTRLSKGGRIILIQTRWHEDDLAGRILEQEGDDWEVLSLPAILASGEPLWPERFDLERLATIRKTVGPREWSALYQQQPQPDEGTYFKREWFQRWGVKPNHLHVYMTSDHAMKEGAGDYTVIRVWGVDPRGSLYLLDGHRAQETSDVWMTQAARLIKIWKPLCWFPENDNTWKAIEPFVRRFLRSQNTLCRIEPLTTAGGDKAIKARGFQAMASMGKVFLPTGLMGDQVLDEYLRFPAGKHDDEIDAAAHMGRALMDAHPAIIPVKEIVHGPQDVYAKARSRMDNDADWMTA